MKYLLALALVARTAYADVNTDHHEASALYKEGVRLFNGGEFTSALDLFQRAWDRYHDARILYSIATTERQLGRTADAANAYQQFIDDPGADPQLASEARAVLGVLDATVGTVVVTIDGDAGEIQVDDLPWSTRGKLRVQPGTFVARGRRTGFTAEATGKVTAGQSVTVTLAWKAIEEPKPVVVEPPKAAPVEPPPPELRTVHWTNRRYAAIGLAGGGAALALGALALELSSRGKISDAEAVCPGLACDGPALATAQQSLSSAATRRNIALLLGGAALATTATGAALWLTARDAQIQIIPASDGESVELFAIGRF